MPGANGLKGLDVAAALGAVIADPGRKLAVLENVGELSKKAFDNANMLILDMLKK